MTDVLTAVLRKGAQELLRKAVEEEVQALLVSYEPLRDARGGPQVVRNGYLPARTLQTSLGDIDVKVPGVRDRGKSGIKFTSALIPPYLRRTKTIEELLPVLDLKGVSTGDCSEALSALVGPQAAGKLAHHLRSGCVGE